MCWWLPPSVIISAPTQNCGWGPSAQFGGNPWHLGKLWQLWLCCRSPLHADGDTLPPALGAPTLVTAGSCAGCALCFKKSKLWILLLPPVQSRCLAQSNCFVITERDRQGSPCKYVWRGSGGDTGLFPWLWEGRTGSCPHAHPVLPLYCIHPGRLAASPAGWEEGDVCGQAAQVCLSAPRPSPSPWQEVL